MPCGTDEPSGQRWLTGYVTLYLASIESGRASAGGDFMIMGRWWQITARLTHDRETHTY
jgi:hypothetical protein